MKITVRGHNQDLVREDTAYMSFFLGDIYVGSGSVSILNLHQMEENEILVDVGQFAEIHEDPEDTEYIMVNLASRPKPEDVEEEED